MLGLTELPQHDSEVEKLGTKLGDIIKADAISLGQLGGRIIAIDAYNTLYAFLSTIRQPDGTPLMDKKGRVTSHLSGLFYRNLNLLESGVRPLYVFDGTAPVLKAAEVQRRRQVRDAAFEAWQQAKEEGRIEDARKAAQASSKLTSEMVDESKRVISALGIPVVQAPSEGEAVAAQMAREGLAWAGASQDNDSLLYNCPRMIRNLTISGRRRMARSNAYKTIEPELIDLDLNLKLLGITREQLIDIAILVGTDYNPGVKGIGQRTALKLVLKHGSLEGIVAETDTKLDSPFQEIRNIFLNPPRLNLEVPKWSVLEEEQVIKILCDEHDFSVTRVKGSIKKLQDHIDETVGPSEQESLTDYF
jgi:flap endonuclease-1